MSEDTAHVSVDAALASEDTALVSEDTAHVSVDTALVSKDTFAENSPMRLSHSSLLRLRGVGVRSRGQQWLLTSGLAISQLVLVYSSTYSCICERIFFDERRT